MASFALQFKSHPIKFHHHQTLISFSHFFSSSSSSNNNDNDGNTPDKFSYLFDIKSRLNNEPTNPRISNFAPRSSSRNVADLSEIRKNLSEFRLRSSPDTGSPANLNSQDQTSFPDFLNRSVGNPNPNPDSARGGGNLSFDVIRQSLKNMRAKQAESGTNVGDQLSSKRFKESFNSKPIIGDINVNIRNKNDNLIGESMENLPEGVFGKEIKERKKEGEENGEARFELIRMYSHAELGQKLKELRPDVSKLGGKKGKKDDKEGEEGWFSLSELQERLGKLRAEEERQSAARMGGSAFGDLRKSIQAIKLTERKGEQAQKTAFQRFDILGSTSLTVSPPKEHLVEKYFHPDNMSAAEKLKLELKRVRDEFKMSESDCGSARVQIAQLTTEIVHLSKVLHKKDKHSRKGLQAKVQQRKKLLKYLRRTDWDSYCFVLSKLGLRDNPDYKN